MAQDSYIKLMAKGAVHEGVIIKVSDVPSIYQDKKLWPVIIRDPKESSRGPEIIESDFLANEIVPGDSQMAKLVGHTVKFVITNPGDGSPNRPPWVKLDEVQSTVEARDKLFIARDAFKMAADLIVHDKADTFTFKTIDELAKRLAEKIITLSKSI